MDKKIIIALIATVILIILFGGITLGNATKKSANNKNKENTNASEQVNSNGDSAETENDIAPEDPNTQDSENTTQSTENNTDLIDDNSENTTSSENDTAESEKEEVNKKLENSETNTEKEESSNDNTPSVPNTPSTPAPETPSTQTPPSESSVPQNPSSSEIANAQAVYSGNEIGDRLDSYRAGLHKWTPDGKYKLYILTTLNGYSVYWFYNNDDDYEFSLAFSDKYLGPEYGLFLTKGSSQYHEYSEHQFMAYYDYDANGDEIYGCYMNLEEMYYDEATDSWEIPKHCKDANGNWYIVDKNGNRVYN